MKKLLSALLVALLGLAIIGCGGGESKPKPVVTVVAVVAANPALHRPGSDSRLV
jgi:hypothetical protein